jgi:hypothetical protein
MYDFSNYYYPFYRSFPVAPAYQPQYYYGPTNSVNAFQSQLANQSVVNTGFAAGINQTANPTTIY